MTNLPPLDGAADAIFRRWGKWCRPTMDRETVGSVVSISLGLGALFDEDEKAERAWIDRNHPELRCSPFHAIVTGRVDEVLRLVNKEREL